uniref:Ribosomal biogenesis factor n=2 Tax=Molossus molossus TaxID=27622 RepID=A0A7J8DSY7_MOLMO|nr:hypothetical protein HJG59_001940 [Molossus molossus]
MVSTWLSGVFPVPSTRVLPLQEPACEGTCDYVSTMAKNKRRGQKSRNVFHIASQKNFKGKSKAKPVTTHLKKINIVNEVKVRRMNAAFVDIQKELAHFSTGLSLEPPHKQLLRRGHAAHGPKAGHANPEFPEPLREVISALGSGVRGCAAPQKGQENQPVDVDEATWLMAQL